MQQWYNWEFEVENLGRGEEDGGGASKDCESNDRKCSRRSRLAAQDHGTNSLERMSADSEEGRTRCALAM